MTTTLPRLAITALLSGLAVLIAPAVQAAGTVGTGTSASCTDAALNTALTGGGLVTFNCGGGAVTVTVLTTQIISLSTTIDGGAGNLITLSGGNALQVIANGAGVLTLQNLTIANGNAGNGGGLENEGTLIVTNSTFTANQAGAGGAIFNGNAGTVTITNSTFSGNTASNGANGGGAIFNSGTGGTVTITNSTFTGNSATAGSGGAIYGEGGLVTLRNVTISGNSAVGSGGGIFDNIDNSQAFNSIVANNTPNNCGASAFDSLSSFNLVSDASCSFSGGTGNLINTNPLLAALASNGGPTQTMALNTGSPAIDTGSPNLVGIDICATVDQRGTVRPQGPRCDIGAFELAAAPASIDPIPTLSEWALIMLAGLVGFWGLMRLRQG